MPNEIESHLPKMGIPLEGTPVNLLFKDGDPRKTAYTVGLLKRHSGVIGLFAESGVLQNILIDGDSQAQKDSLDGHSVRVRDDHWKRRKHMAPEHCVTVAAGCRAIGDLLVESGSLEETDVLGLEKAALAHDYGKPLEVGLVSVALSDDFSEKKTWELIRREFPAVDHNANALKAVKRTVVKADAKVNKGMRGLLLYDLAGDLNEIRLREFGFTEELIYTQRMVGHASCPESEELVSNFVSGRKPEIVALVIHYVDDIVTSPNIIDPVITWTSEERENALDRRCGQNENNPKYVEYNAAWPEYFGSGNETAFQMQRRVGHLVENKLAELLGIEDPLVLPQIISARINSNILNNWSELQAH